MAAQPHPSALEIVDLPKVAPGGLDELLAEETQVWLHRLNWDFNGSAELVRRFANTHSLNGKALLFRGNVVGYSYFIAEEGKGLLGDLYVMKQFSTPELENQLLSASVEELIRNWNCARVECQLILTGSTLPHVAAFGKLPAVFERNFMMLLESCFSLSPRQPKDLYIIEPFGDHMQEDASRLIAESYAGHVDATINDQYRSVAGARRFLRNIIQYPGCGSFSYGASFVARDRGSNRAIGLSLASSISTEAGHITQLCISPKLRGTGLGYELLRRSIKGLSEIGARQISLTVTSKNKLAVNLYERLGFRTMHCFPAMVWEKKSATAFGFFRS